jgi:hypothetical protein
MVRVALLVHLLFTQEPKLTYIQSHFLSGHQKLKYAPKNLLDGKKRGKMQIRDGERIIQLKDCFIHSTEDVVN